MNTLRRLFGKDVLRDFWHWFAKHRERYYRFEENQDQLFGAMHKKLKEIHPSLTFEFSPVRGDGTRELTISADGIKDAFPYVVQLTDRAPRIEKWKINAFRQRIPADDLVVQIESVKVGYGDIFFSHMLSQDLLHLDLYIRNYEEDDRYKNAVFILLDSLLGEYDMEMKVGKLNFSALGNHSADKLQPFVKIRSLVDSMAGE